MSNFVTVRDHTILVADDEPGIRSLLSIVLTTHGYTVLTAENGNQVIDALSSETPFDLLLLDLVMPDCEGLELLQQLRSAGYGSENLKMIAMSGFSGCMLDVARALGADATLPKPFSFGELLATVAGLLEQRSWPDQADPQIELDLYALNRLQAQDLGSLRGARQPMPDLFRKTPGRIRFCRPT